MDSKKPYIIGIAGGTGSGKTTIARKVVDHFKNSILHIPHDRYYNDQSHLEMAERVKTNYDHPKSLETDLFIKHVEELLQGKSVQMPEYDFTTHTRKSETTTENPAPLILIGAFLFMKIQRFVI
jgi:uridine kinase